MLGDERIVLKGFADMLADGLPAIAAGVRIECAANVGRKLFKRVCHIKSPYLL
jgi:hypothetical protein